MVDDRSCNEEREASGREKGEEKGERGVSEVAHVAASE